MMPTPASVRNTAASTGMAIWIARTTVCANSRSNPDETQLSAANVNTVRRLWETPVQGSTSTPAVADGVMYLRTLSHLMTIGGK